MRDAVLGDLAVRLLAACRASASMLATAESCTGGLVAAAITAVPGSSEVFDRGFVTYANQAKTDLLGVPDAMLVEFGAVSEPVARAMAEGAVRRSAAGFAVAVTGIAGPGGGSALKPVGLVHIAVAGKGGPTRHQRHQFPGDRDTVRHRAAEAALQLLLHEVDRPR